VRNVRLTGLNGGHPSQFPSRQGSAFEVVTGTKGTLLGIAPQARFQNTEIMLNPGDRILLYSDGVTEVENPARKMLLQEGTLACLDRYPADGNSESLVAALARGVADFSGTMEQTDDITIMALRYLGHDGPDEIPEMSD
jgi:phosphoserine phosphatase RsbU/P